jgi:hypothetical protein
MRNRNANKSVTQKRSKNIKMKKMLKCKHYKGDGYSFRMKGQEIRLCETCYKMLLSQMKQQEKWEKICKRNKIRRKTK